MPRQSTATEARITNITECLTPAITLLKELNDAFAPPFIEPLANTTLALITGIEVMHFLVHSILG
jgi:hypothetical protein